jgi:hydroxymethylbilane synthase
MKVRIGTRGSDLALWQARHVRAQLESQPGVECEIVVLKTRGDLIDDVPLQSVEGKGFFTAEIERALLDERVDLAVHSHKDLATENPPGLVVAGIPPRASPLERLLVRPEAWDADVPLLPVRQGAKVGTSAPRRQEQLLALRPDLTVLDLRGNVPTRVNRLREGRYDAIVLAAAGLDRLELDLSGLEWVDLPLEQFVPSPAQGALAIQVRAADSELIALVERCLHDEQVAQAVEAERQLLVDVGGGCNLPLGAQVLPPGAPSTRPQPPTHPGGPTDPAAGDARSAGSWRAIAFLGADHPRPGQRARWIEAEGPDPQEAMAAVFAGLAAGEPTGRGPLAGLSIALTGSVEGPSELSERLTTLGATLVPECAIAFEDLGAAARLPERVAGLRPGDALAITSRRAAAYLDGTKPPAGVRIAAVGPATARALGELGLHVDVIGDGGARELASRLELAEGARVLFPCAEQARDELEGELGARGVAVERLELYRTVPVEGLELAPDVDARIYLSPSAVQAALAAERAAPASRALRLALGRTTAEALDEAGLEAEPAIGGPSLVEALVHRLLQSVPGQPA